MLGALLAFSIAYVFRGTIASLASSGPLGGATSLYVTSSEAIYTGIVILVVGGLIGALGSAFAVRRFLAV
jgi:cell division protein FtsX